MVDWIESPLPVNAIDRPQVRVQVAFQNDPSVNPDWWDVTPYLRDQVHIKRGRQHELDRFEAGTATFILDNTTGVFTPNNPNAGPYPFVLPVRRCRISAVIHGHDYALFDGFIDELPFTETDYGNHRVQVKATDGFKVLALKKLNMSFPSQMSHVRVNAIMDQVGWNSGQSWILGDAAFSLLGVTTFAGPVGDRDVGPGSSMLDAVTLTDVPALTHLQDIQGSENGLFFIDRTGAVLFRGRAARVKPPYTTIYGLFGDDPTLGELSYVADSMVLSYDDSLIYNEVRVKRGASGAVEQVVQDANSQTKYWPRTLSIGQSLVTTDNEALNEAQWLLNQYAEPHVRVVSFNVWGFDDVPWELILNRELSDRVTVRVRPGGILVEQVSWIEGIEITVKSLQDWTVSWALAPADTQTYWILEDAFAGLLGVSTRLGY